MFICKLNIDAINTQQHSATGVTPYELVFGQPPFATIIPLVAGGAVLINDVTLDDDDDVDFFSLPVDDQQKYMMPRRTSKGIYIYS